jgi:hypothetical protein
MELIIGNRYNWKHSGEPPLIYVGNEGAWYQFAKVDEPDVVWCEILLNDLWERMEETVK